MAKDRYVKTRILEVKVPGRRLGRHVNHDPRSWDYPIAEFFDTKKKLCSKHWRRYFPPLDQGDPGSCTGNAMVGLLATHPLHTSIKQGGPHLTEATALELYSIATAIDEFGGQYPPTDTGSSTLGVLKAAQRQGYIGSYYWGFGLHDMQYCVSQVGSVIVGTNWYEGMDHPDGEGRIRVRGEVRGGHEYQIVGIDTHDQTFVMENSWGPDWGHHGRAVISWHDMDRLLSEDGEVGVGRK
jgi:hypothetical protein